MIEFEIPAVFEDECLLVVNKPAGLPVHATVDKTRPHVQGILEKRLKRTLVLFHRIDLDTTGLLVFGKDPSINQKMTDLFRGREVEKTYWAVVDGRWDPNWDKVETYIKKVSGGKYINGAKGSGGDQALTKFRLIESIGEKSWIEAKPETGRTHQIRLHCKHLNHPILGDSLYGRIHPKRIPMALHARALKFEHPVTKENLTLVAQLPKHWRQEWLKGFSAVSDKLE